MKNVTANNEPNTSKLIVLIVNSYVTTKALTVLVLIVFGQTGPMPCYRTWLSLSLKRQGKSRFIVT